jgi:hypothetical protein
MASNWAQVSDLQARVTYETISTTSTPTTAQVQTWIEDAEARVRLALAAAGLTTTYTGDATSELKLWVIDYPLGEIQCAWATAQGESSDVGEALKLRFEDRIEWIRKNPEAAADRLGQLTSTSDVIRVRSHITHHPDGHTVSGGDFTPAFTTTTEL